MNQEDFFKQYSISSEAFEKSGLCWKDLTAIAEDYDRVKPQMESIARYGAETLMTCKAVHSINYRIKNKDHLIEKIIRKSIKDPEIDITIDNYRSVITDLIGIRALHLFKEDWTAVHSFVSETWDLVENPVAYVRFGDSERILQYYRDNKCELKEHKYGYRSVHYLAETTPNKIRYVIEIQVRTIFEEAWGEIDHRIRYPYDSDNEMYLRLSSILNRLAGNADEMSSFMRYLKNNTDRRNTEIEQLIESKNQEIAQLRAALQENRPETITANKESIFSGIKEDSRDSSEMDFPWLEDFMESKLAKGLKGQIDQFVKSEYFSPIDVTEKDMESLMRAQKEMMKILDNSGALKNMLSNPQGAFPLLEGGRMVPGDDEEGS